MGLRIRSVNVILACNSWKVGGDGKMKGIVQKLAEITPDSCRWISTGFAVAGRSYHDSVKSFIEPYPR